MTRSRRTLAAIAMLGVALAVLQWREVARAFKSLTPEQLHVGDSAPALAVSGADGTPISETEFHGRPMLVSFWAAWCAPCRLELPDAAGAIRNWNGQAKPADRVTMIAVNQGDDPASLSMFVNDSRLEAVRFVFDPKLETGARWKVEGLPTTFLVDRSGTVVMVQVGYDVGFASRLFDLLKRQSATEPDP